MSRKPSTGKERAAKEEERRERTARARTERPEPGRERDQPGVERVLPRNLRVHGPMRVREDEIRGPEQFVEVEPDHAAGEQRALQHVEVVIRALLAPIRCRSDPRSKQPACRGDDEPRDQRGHITLHVDVSTLPPEDHEQRRGERRRDGFRHQRADEQRGRDCVGACGLRSSSKRRYEKRGEQIEHERERVLLPPDIHATDSTLTGCSAKIAPASQAPLMASRWHTVTTRHAAITCRTTLTRW